MKVIIFSLAIVTGVIPAAFLLQFGWGWLAVAFYAVYMFFLMYFYFRKDPEGDVDLKLRHYAMVIGVVVVVLSSMFGLFLLVALIMDNMGFFDS